MDPWTGLDILLKASIPEAAHDSSARHPPPSCHPGTRKDYIGEITFWGLNAANRKSRILWLRGPAGVGKSAVAQSCAEALGPKLGAAFFFSHPNRWDDPNRLFTSISYQLATKCESYKNILDAKVRGDPTLVSKAIRQQFQELIVAPSRGLEVCLDELVVIIDGLDECPDTDLQCDIINTIATSVRDHTTPLLWAFFSRPEPHIVATFTSDEISPLSLHMELPVSREADQEILRYLADKLEGIRRRHGLPYPWPSEQHIWDLVDLSDGLFIYATTLIRFIGALDSSGPDDQLFVVLSFMKDKMGHPNSGHPLSELDSFYMLVMQRVPLNVLLTLQHILLLTIFERPGSDATDIADLLGLSEPQLRYACHALHSVLTLKPHSDNSARLGIWFYHASFMQFLLSPMRSGNFCIILECGVILREQLLRRLSSIHTGTTVVI